MLKSNWHTHTYRCEHAKGKDEEYVVAAIEAGVERLGFSDHAPYPGVIIDKHRMRYEEYLNYVTSIKELKEKYKNEIEIYIGLEIEYYTDYLDTLKDYRKELDYLILGQHGFTVNDEKSYFIYNKEDLYRYCELIEQGCASGLVDCVVHPDVCLWSYPRIDDAVKEVAERIADASIKYRVPVEVNCGSGVFRGKQMYEDGERYPYPTRAFFEAFAKKGCEVVIGLDIHDPLLFKTDEYINRAMSVLDGLGCNIIEDYDMIEAAKSRKEKYLKENI